jgi:hypothetical protein
MFEKVTTLSFTDAELKVINDALQLAPFGQVAPVMLSINQQIAKINSAQQEKA